MLTTRTSGFAVNYRAPERTWYYDLLIGPDDLIICADGLINCPDKLLNRPDGLINRSTMSARGLRSHGLKSFLECRLKNENRANSRNSACTFFVHQQTCI